MAVIVLNKVTKRYNNNTVLKSFSMEIQQGEFVAVMGASGSGKSTLFNVIGLLEDIDEGRIIVNDYVDPKPSALMANIIQRRHIGYLFQDFALAEEKTVEYNLQLALDTASTAAGVPNLHDLPNWSGWPGNKRDNRNRAIDEALKRVELGELKKSTVAELSGADKQRVAIARLWLKPCNIVLADEPTGSLDPKSRGAILGLIKDLHSQGKTVLIFSHDPIIGRECRRVIQL
ncbi:MAG: ATP-binding cassette domain-containing protein [Peptococcaceae bacterium]|nr:ATP-binding cassette domain-containing protein [Peptococcaceae bacterium]